MSSRVCDHKYVDLGCSHCGRLPGQEAASSPQLWRSLDMHDQPLSGPRGLGRQHLTAQPRVFTLPAKPHGWHPAAAPTALPRRASPLLPWAPATTLTASPLPGRYAPTFPSAQASILAGTLMLAPPSNVRLSTQRAYPCDQNLA